MLTLVKYNFKFSDACVPMIQLAPKNFSTISPKLCLLSQIGTYKGVNTTIVTLTLRLAYHEICQTI